MRETTRHWRRCGLANLLARSDAWNKGPTMANETPGPQVDADRSLRASIERSGDTTLLRVGGEVDIATEPELRALLRSVDGDVVVDLARVTFLDACGIGAFVSERRRLARDGGILMLRAPVPAIRRVLDVVGLADWIVE